LVSLVNDAERHTGRREAARRLRSRLAGMPRVALLTPFAFPSIRGNAVTVERIARGLRERGVTLRMWDLSALDDAAVAREVDAYQPSLIHAFHAFRVGPLALRLARRAEIPLVVTLTGTDANHDLFDPERAPVVRRVLEGAGAITAFHDSIVARVAASLPDVGARLVVVPQAVRFDATEPFDLSAHWALPAARVLFLFPAGIRMVKRPLLPLPVFDRVVAARPDIRLLYAGPVLDDAEGRALARELSGRPWARHLGAVPHAQMPSLLLQSDVVMNCSLSEGGMANSILEAFAQARAVLASDIAGNRALVQDDVTGLIFSDDRSLETAALRLGTDGALRARLGAAGRALVERRYPPSREVDGYAEVYGTLSRVRTT
jgi:glycosyltransferase involved in cell wall biosynthesis